MGNAGSNEPVDNRTGMSKHDTKLVRESWRTFCEKDRHFGLALLMAMLSSHPEYLVLFPRFKNVPMHDLANNPKFRELGGEVGRHFTAFIDALDDTDKFIELVRKNAEIHLKYPGVQPRNFESFFAAAMQEMIAANKTGMTPATVSAWDKLFEALNMITRNVYDEASKVSPATEKQAHQKGKSSVQEPAASGASAKAHGSLSPAKAGHKASVSPLAVQSFIKGSHSKRKPLNKHATQNKDNSPRGTGQNQ